MNNRTEKTVITIETFRRTTFRSRHSNIVWCELCKAETVMVPPDEAAANMRCTTREVFRLAETGGLHFSETESGSLLVCGESCRARLR